VDYFQNKERMKCRLYHKKYSPIEFFKKHRKEIEEKAMKNYGILSILYKEKERSVSLILVHFRPGKKSEKLIGFWTF
jgi:hypothetical protein